MILQRYLDDEIELAQRIFLYYSDKMIDYASVNNSKYLQWFVDSMQIEILLETLQSISPQLTTNYLGAIEVDDDFVVNVFYKVREYWLQEIDTDYVIGDINNIIIPNKSTYQPYTIDWKTVNIEITEDNTTVINLPFDTSLVDIDSLVVSVDDGSAIPIAAPSNGYTITGNTLTWHHYFELNLGNILHVKYLQIKGLV